MNSALKVKSSHQRKSTNNSEKIPKSMLFLRLRNNWKAKKWSMSLLTLNKFKINTSQTYGIIFYLLGNWKIRQFTFDGHFPLGLN